MPEIPDIAALLRQCAAEVRPMTPASLAEFFGLPERHFHAFEPGGPILFHPAHLTSPPASLLRGTIFWPDRDFAPGVKRMHAKPQQIIRGLPRFTATSDYTQDTLEIAQEPRFARAALEGSGGEAFAEPKLYGRAIRVYSAENELYCATDVSHDGGNPVVGAGIDNSRALGIDYAGQAARILTQKYGRVERLARLGYVAVFVLQLPEFAPDGSVDHADMILVDVIDSELLFVDRLEKERVAEDYGLTVVELAARLTLPAPQAENAPPPGAMAFLRRCRALEHQAAQSGGPGFIVKGCTGEGAESDQMFAAVESSSERDRTRELTRSDFAGVTEEISSQFGGTVWSDEPEFAEALMLEYLGTRHRTARWQVAEYLDSWRNARKLAGLG